MQLSALGGLKLNGADFVRVKPLLLLTYVTLEGSKDRHFLAELFWPGAANPLNSLAVAVQQLRQHAPRAVESNHTHVASAVECDATTFLGFADANNYKQALELYRGPFLSGVYLTGWSAELEEWVYGTREFLAGRARSALLRLGEEVAANGRFEDAVKYAETAYLLPGAPELDPEEFERVYALLVAGHSPHVGRLRKDAQSLGIRLFHSSAEARAQLRPSSGSSGPGISGQRLPTRGTSFIGRGAELVELASQLARPDCALLTLTGPGGVGKSRLAVRVAKDLSERYRDGIYFISLEALEDVSLIPSSIAGVLDFSLQGSEDPLGQLICHIGNKAVLLVLDNYEHLLDGATIVTALLHACPNLKLLVTSRERLNLEEEWVLPLEGFVVPAETISPPNATHHDALRLFEDRAKRARLSFELTPQELPYVFSICNQVQGLPLGIELAAAWVKMLSCAEIAQEIERTTDLPTSASRSVPPRHRSIRTVFEHSWRLLTPKEREVLSKLSVFQGGFRREAAAEVAGATIPMLASLVDKSLLRVTAGGRYDYHPLIHRYAYEKLAEYPDNRAITRERHGRYYVRFLEVQGAELIGVRQHEGLVAIGEELENIRAAWRWAVEGKRVDELRRAASPLAWFHEISGQFQEGMNSFGAAVSVLEEIGPEHRDTLSRMLLEYSGHTYRLSLFPQAMQAATRGLDLARVLCNDDLIAHGLDLLGQIAWQVGDFSTSVQHLEEALVLAAARNDAVLIASLTRSIGWVENKKGDYPSAKKRLQESLILFRELEMPHEVVNNLNALGHLHINAGWSNEAQPFFEEGLKLARETGAQVMVPHLLSGAGLALYELGNYPGARVVLERSLHETANELAQAWVLVVLGRVATAMADYALAQDYVDQALKMSWAVRQLPEVLDALVALSELRIKQGYMADAAVTLHLAASHSATTGYSRALAQRLLKSLVSSSSTTAHSDTYGGQTPLEEVVVKLVS